ncbi:MAG TPA: hypothetical protein DCE13_00945 [Cryomorphaceae bacterium]|jgi:hypothetical protein|nr:MAG: hypothetical protein ABR88_01950 [Cryomorphaceae bacterium BACL7 MAG-120322-bin74]HAB31088.1 hypothetical protein [Cryomorphaceae bacterium]
MRRLWAILLCLTSLLAHAQLRPGQRVDILRSSTVTVKRTSQGPLTVLKGDVALKNKEGIFYCDSAHWWKREDRFLAYGSIRYKGNAGVVIQSQTLDYKEGLTFLRGNVILVHEGQTLRTPSLRFDTESGMGVFQQGGEVRTTDGDLTCQSGRYMSNEEHFIFEGNVHAVTEEYVLECPKLEQWPKERRYLVPKGGMAYNRTGRTEDQQSGHISFERAYLWSSKDLQQSAFAGEVKGKDSTIQFTADSLYRREGETELFGGSTPAKWADWSNDSLEIHGTYIYKDAFMAIAKGAVKTFAKGVSSTSAYVEWLQADSVFYFYGSPRIWTSDYLLCSDTLRWFQQHPSGLDSIYGVGEVHLSKPVDSLRYDEMSGNTLHGFLHNEGAKQLTVSGNAQALLQTDPTRTSHIACAAIVLDFAHGKLVSALFQKSPTGDVAAPLEGNHLPGFSGNASSPPARMAPIFGLK